MLWDRSAEFYILSDLGDMTGNGHASFAFGRSRRPLPADLVGRARVRGR